MREFEMPAWMGPVLTSMGYQNLDAIVQYMRAPAITVWEDIELALIQLSIEATVDTLRILHENGFLNVLVPEDV